MATTEVEICNMGLFRAGQTVRISSFDEPSTYAMVCRTAYPIARDAVLAEPGTYWPFARRRVKLSRIDAEGLDLGGFRFAYALPADMISPVGIQPYTRNPRMDEEIPYVIEQSLAGPGLWLLTDHPAPIFEYTQRIEAPSLFSPLFADALAWRIALELVVPLSLELRVQQACERGYLTALSKAAADTSNYRRNDPPPLPESIAVRDF